MVTVSGASNPEFVDDSAAFVSSLYEAFLKREPDGTGEAFYLDLIATGTNTHADLVRAFAASSEHKRTRGIDPSSGDFRLFPGYAKADLAIFDEFRPKDLQAKPGFVTDYIGSRTRISMLWDGCAGLDNVINGIPDPCDHFAHTTEWLGTLKAVKSAGDRFAAMELGAGLGPWLVASGVAARNRGIRDISLLGVEADPRRCASMKVNLADNEFDATVVQAAVGIQAGTAKWPRLDDFRNQAGSRPVRRTADGGLNEDDASHYTDPVALDIMIDVTIVAFDKLLRRQRLWDLIHIDVQGTEGELCAAFGADLSECARWLVIGTHSRKLDGDVMETLFAAGWHLEHEVPTRLMPYRPGLPSLVGLTSHDGTQVWRNPRF